MAKKFWLLVVQKAAGNWPSVTNQDTKFNPERRFSLSKAERLNHQRDFDQLFAQGNILYAKGIRFVYLLIPNTADKPLASVKVAFVVPKRNIRKAVQRNLAKRRMRESFRLRKHQFLQLLEPHHLRLALAIICLHKSMQPQTDFENAINHFLQALATRFQPSADWSIADKNW